MSTAAILHSKRMFQAALMVRDAASLNAVCNLDVFQCKNRSVDVRAVACSWSNMSWWFYMSCHLSRPNIIFAALCSNYRIASWYAFWQVTDGGSWKNQGHVENRRWRSIAFLYHCFLVCTRFDVPELLLVWRTAVTVVLSILVKFSSLRIFISSSRHVHVQLVQRLHSELSCSIVVFFVFCRYALWYFVERQVPVRGRS